MTAAVGASAIASESQPCSGKAGTLTAKATRKASEANQSAAELPEMLWVAASCASSGSWKVPVLAYTQSMPTSRMAEGMKV